jgi:xanthine dehydrogenase YagS FAD-binding subunit
MNAFEYASPATVEQAAQALGVDNGAALSGGTDLINRMKDGVASPSRVVCLKRIEDPNFATIMPGKDGYMVGAGVTLADLVAHADLAKAAPALVQAAHEVGTLQIRNMATVGGNLAQRPRCWYFRRGHGVAGDVAAMIREGDNRYHAIYMTDGPALFVNPSSLAPALIALNAKAAITGPGGSRVIPVAELFTVPKSADVSELTLAPGEVISSLTIPTGGWVSASYEARQKQSHDWPLVLASAACQLDGKVVRKASIVLGAVAPIPYVATAAQEAIAGKEITAETATEAAEAAAKGAKPLSMNAYKVALVKTCVKRALLSIAGDRYWEA